LVMAARSCSLSEAFSWLEERVLPKKAEVEVDWDKILETSDAPPLTGGEEGAEGRDGAPPPKDEPKKRRINPMPLILPREQDIPRRQFLYGSHYMRGTVSSTIGTGGTGKSTLGLTEGISMEIARDLIGEEILREPLRVWYHNAEETLEELLRRVAA